MIKKNKLIKKKAHKGDVTKIINNKSNYFYGFGELYISEIKSKKIKGWKKHKRMTMNLKVIQGRVKFVFITKNNKKYKEIILHDKDLKLITVPKKTIFAFQGLNKKNMIINFSNIQHESNECLNYPINKFNYNWK